MVKKKNQKIITDIEKKNLKIDLPNIQIGDNIQIGVKIFEANKERIQFYEGIVLATKNKNNLNKAIIVRKIFQDIGIERTFFIHSPNITTIRISRSSKVRRAKLYYLRNLKGKSMRLRQN